MLSWTLSERCLNTHDIPTRSASCVDGWESDWFFCVYFLNDPHIHEGLQFALPLLIEILVLSSCIFQSEGR